jgi:hypothetical protein
MLDDETTNLESNLLGVRTDYHGPGGTTHMISARLCDPSDHDQFEAK